MERGGQRIIFFGMILVLTSYIFLLHLSDYSYDFSDRDYSRSKHYDDSYLFSDKYSNPKHYDNSYDTHFPKNKRKYYGKDYEYLKYHDRGEYRSGTGIFGNQVDDYVVSVKNKDYVGGYFTVKFYFSDYYGDRITDSVTHYIKPYEERKFSYRTIYGNDYHGEGYQVISDTKSSRRRYHIY